MEANRGPTPEFHLYFSFLAPGVPLDAREAMLAFGSNFCVAMLASCFWPSAIRLLPKGPK